MRGTEEAWVALRFDFIPAGDTQSGNNRGEVARLFPLRKTAPRWAIARRGGLDPKVDWANLMLGKKNVVDRLG
jgi:hypothetical protein